MVSGNQEVGGLVGKNFYGSVLNCYSTGRVRGESGVAGLVGYNLYGSLLNCYSAGAVIGRHGGAGLACGTRGTVVNCFWDIETSGQTESGGGTGLTTAEMQDINTYLEAGWDFWGERENGLHETWTISEDNDYPALSIFHGFQPRTLSGDGTCDFPYLISNARELGAILYHNPNALYQITRDIDLSEITWSTSVIPELSGSFNGHGFAIHNLTITGDRGLGLIGTLMPGAQVRNLAVTNADVAGTGTGIGIITGDNNWGSVLNCYSTGTASGNKYVGGLVGDNYSGEVFNSYSTSTVSGGRLVGGLLGHNSSGKVTDSYSAGMVSGERLVGGLVGYNYEGNVLNCYNGGTVSGEETIGGLVGWNLGEVLNSYSTGTVIGVSSVGGLVGSGGHVNSSFWDIEASGQTESGGGAGLTTAEMQDINTYLEAGWDFIDETENGTEDIWFIRDQDYPCLTWELLNFSQRIEIDDVDAKIGKIIRVEGWPQLGEISCTLMDCPQDDPCCNRCWAPLILNSTEGRLYLIGEDIECSGTECRITCSSIQPGREYALEGILRDPITLEVIDYEDLSDFIVVDDFEAYDDYCNRVFYAWLDGYGHAGNVTCGVEPYGGNRTGSAVGWAGPWWPDIVHGGQQSMPFDYDNSGTGTNSRGQPIDLYYSETERTFDTPQDWTRAGVRALTLYFHGDADNDAGATEQMYLKVNGAKVVYDGDIADIKQESWHEWNIDLKQFTDAGVNLEAVKKMYIGVGDRNAPQPGGSGRLFFDDIRLYRPRCIASIIKPEADLSGNCVVDLADIEILAGEWLQSGAGLTADLDADADVDLADFAEIADGWHEQLLWPQP
jgi:hypothetical protein